MTGRIYLSAPDVGALEEEFLLDAVRSGWVAPLGPHVSAFEAELSDWSDTTHAVALSSGTAALHLALLATGVGPGQTVIVPTMTFAATANAVHYTGARPFFVDCQLSDGNLDVALLDDVLTRLIAAGHDVGAVIPVDLLGVCADYGALLPVCAEHGVPVIEDAAESLGASWHGRPAGSFGRAGVFSFNGNKIMTTSGGGMLVSNDADLVERCRYLATQARQPVVHYEHTDIGFNYRLSNLLAAVGRAQLRRLAEMIERRRQLRDRYAKLFTRATGVRLLGDDDQESNCWLTAIVVDPDEAGWCAADLAKALGTQDIETRPLWKPMHRQPVHADAGAAITGAADALFARGLTLPSGSSLSATQIDLVAETIVAFLEARS